MNNVVLMKIRVDSTILGVLCKVRNTSATYHLHAFMLICFAALLCIAHYILSLKEKKVIIVLTKKDCALRHLYQMHAVATYPSAGG